MILDEPQAQSSPVVPISSLKSKYHRYRFRFESESLAKSDQIFITGNYPALGEWDLSKARQLTYVTGVTWSLSDVVLPESFDYKYFCKGADGQLKWEETEPRSVRILPSDDPQLKTLEIKEICFIDHYGTTEHIMNICHKQWWKESVVYQIYPRSFCDSNNDGVGDLRGIIGKLDYLQNLGIDVIWLSPVYKTPNDDNGYDISDYEDVNPEFGTLADWEELLAKAHSRGIKIVMDLVVNHTSDEHWWFTESRKSKESPYRDYYIWKPPHPKTGKEPTNWASFFSGSTWQFDELTGEYYLHLFSKKQPDLNWENPKLRAEIFKMMQFWLAKGIDGFRMDVINCISKDPNYPDAAEKVGDAYHWGGEYFINGPKLWEYLKEMKDRVLKHHPIITVGETPFFNVGDGAKLTNEQTGPVNMLFHFELMGVDIVPGQEKWEFTAPKLGDMRKIMNDWQLELQGKGWNSLYLENHDQPRSLSRFGNDGKYRKESAKMLATWLHMMQGTPYVYQGQEIGMTNVAFGSIDDYRDIETKNYYREAVNDKGVSPQRALTSIHKKGRDNARTPVQWDASPNAGFTGGSPWIAVNPNYTEINVEQALSDPDSIYYYYQKLIKLRKSNELVVYGGFVPLLNDHDEIYAYLRPAFDRSLLVVCNFSANPLRFEVPGSEKFEYAGAEVILSNYADIDKTERCDSFSLRPYEARIYLLEGFRTRI